MRSESSIQTEFHHQGLRVGEGLLLTAVEWLRHKEVLAKNSLDDLKVLVGIVCLTESLLPSHLAWTSVHAIRSWSSLAWVLPVGEH
jgi:hypothetical protein